MSLAVAQLGLGAIQTGVALYKLRQLSKQRRARFSDNIAPLQRNVDMWQNRMDSGLPLADYTRAMQTQAQQQAGAYRSIADNTVGMGGYFARVAGLDRVNLASQLANMSQQERMNAMRQLGQSRQILVNQMNMDTRDQIQQRMMTEQALGGALRAGTQNMAQAIDYSRDPERAGNQNAAQTTNYSINPYLAGLMRGNVPNGNPVDQSGVPVQNTMGIVSDPTDNSTFQTGYGTVEDLYDSYGRRVTYGRQPNYWAK